MKYQVSFYATQYAEHHLAPDVIKFDADTDAEASRALIDKLAEILGHPRGLITLVSEVSTYSDEEDVFVTSRIGGDREYAGYVLWDVVGE